MATHTLDIPWKEEIHFPLSPMDPAPLMPARVACEHWGGGMRIEGTTPGREVLVFLMQGSGWLQVGDERTELVGPMAVVFGGSTAMRLWTGEGREMKLYIVACGGRDPEAVVRGFLGCGVGAFPLADPLAVEGLFVAMMAEARGGGRYAQEICQRYVEIALRRIAQDRVDGAGDRGTQAQATLRRCRAYMDQHFRELQTVADVARACELSQSYLTRLFDRYERMTPYEYLTRLKLNMAVQLLLTTDRQVQAIAAELNFDDPYTFTRLFRRRLGCTPSVYRSRQR